MAAMTDTSSGGGDTMQVDTSTWRTTERLADVMQQLRQHVGSGQDMLNLDALFDSLRHR